MIAVLPSALTLDEGRGFPGARYGLKGEPSRFLPFVSAITQASSVQENSYSLMLNCFGLVALFLDSILAGRFC